ncbi:hypothetical protein NC653_041974 [Populus alba x Populus x berolinensis]|uniref:Uncharacterized protein n=1 Tax=Populus alba x Populus x berolinensis TaxID=444605 RepID=A0AAD6LBD9_9ROSI|nr:hypothetical protein NC653_041974 [Populus alba x Populus x berolinensis]
MAKFSKAGKQVTPTSIQQPNNAMGHKREQSVCSADFRPLASRGRRLSVGGWEVVKRKQSTVRLKETLGPAAPNRVTCRDNAVQCSNKGRKWHAQWMLAVRVMTPITPE